MGDLADDAVAKALRQAELDQKAKEAAEKRDRERPDQPPNPK